MDSITIEVTVDPDLLQALDALAETRGITRAEAVLLACRDFVRQLQQMRQAAQPPAQPAPHATELHANAAAFWEAAWIGEVIDPTDTTRGEPGLLPG